MLYQSDTKTLIHVVAPGAVVTESQLASFARMIGQADAQGPIERVAVVFVGGPDEAEPHLPTIKKLGLVCRAIDRGVERVLHEGSPVQPATKKATLLPILREETWPNLATVVHRRMLVGKVDVGPWVTFGWDEGGTLARFAPKHLAGHTIADVEREALANLADEEAFAPEMLKPRMVVVHGEYSSETILLPDVMRACARALGARLICVSIPMEARLVAVPADAIDDALALMIWTRKMFDEATGRRISPLPFLVDDGQIVGFASAKSTVHDAAPAPAPKKSWYKFW